LTAINQSDNTATAAIHDTIEIGTDGRFWPRVGASSTSAGLAKAPSPANTATSEALHRAKSPVFASV
jgi:hypothetical protein